MSKVSRELRLTRWAEQALGRQNITVPDSFALVKASDDASFRRYFRAITSDGSYIFVDAPPELEDSMPFVDIADRLGRYGLNAPRVYEADLEQGFMMLSDLGDELYLSAVEAGSETLVERLYEDAFAGLVRMHRIPVTGMPPYDERLLREEMDLFPDWFLARQLGIELSGTERDLLNRVFDMMVENANAQPVVFVHRDYHSRNLMVTRENNPGILDFQDAVSGPVTYDLVSLLRDCYLRFSRERVLEWVESMRKRLVDEKLMDATVSSSTFRRWFDLMGLQRHIKCAGIFSRLHLRDGKPGYLCDIPLVVTYIQEVCECYGELEPFAVWMSSRILPLMHERPEFGRR